LGTHLPVIYDGNPARLYAHTSTPLHKAPRRTLTLFATPDYLSRPFRAFDCYYPDTQGVALGCYWNRPLAFHIMG